MRTGFLHKISSLLAVRHSYLPHFNFSGHAILALVAGVLILIRPKLLNFIVAAYLIIIGLLELSNFHW